MELEDALFEWTSGQTAVTSLIGAAPQVVRFYKLKIPQGSKFPAMVQQRTGAPREQRGCTVDGAVQVSLQVDFYARTWAEMARAAKAFRKSLSPDAVTFPIIMGGPDSPAGMVKVKAANLDNEFDGEDPEPGLVRRTQLWSFWVFESSQA